MTKFSVTNTIDIPEQLKNAVVVIGNFDGVHIAHQKVIGKAKEIAKKQKLPVVALSFEPHPRTLFKPESPVFRLTPQNMKARILEAYGIDGLVILPFTSELANTTAEQFIQTYLINHIAAAHITIGFNLHFGKNREGSPQFLKQKGEELGFGVTIVEECTDDTQQPISSSRIRRCIGQGNVEEAAKMLGYRWTLNADIIKGEQIGRTLGYPTANMQLEPECRLANAIYAVRLRNNENNKLYNAVASFGRRPTFDNGPKLFETFIFDFDEDIYGKNVEVSLFEFIRKEEKFDGEKELKKQMVMDEQKAREILEHAKPISEMDERITFDGLIK